MCLMQRPDSGAKRRDRALLLSQAPSQRRASRIQSAQIDYNGRHNENTYARAASGCGTGICRQRSGAGKSHAVGSNRSHDRGLLPTRRRHRQRVVEVRAGLRRQRGDHGRIGSQPAVDEPEEVGPRAVDGRCRVGWLQRPGQVCSGRGAGTYADDCVSEPHAHRDRRRHAGSTRWPI